MIEAELRGEQKTKADKTVEALGVKMRTALSNMSNTPDGLLLLRYLMYECRFLSPLMFETPEGVNTDVMIASEAKRGLYLSLRKFMDRGTLMRVELPEEQQPIKGGNNG